MQLKTNRSVFRFADFFTDPVKSLILLVIFITLLWSVQCSLFQSVLAKDVIEALSWGAVFEWGSYKHPPLTGWLADAFFNICGRQDWSMYLLSQLTIAFGMIFVYKLAREFFDRNEAVCSVLLLYTLIFYNPSGMKFTTNHLEAAFHPMIAYYFYVSVKYNKIQYWLMLALAAALGLLSKYSAGLLLLACFMYMLYNKEARKRFASAGPYLSGILTLLLLSPHICWLWENDFICFSHLGNRLYSAKSPFMFLLVAAMPLVPLAIEGVFLGIASLPWKKQFTPRPINRDALEYSLFCLLTPAVFFTISSIMGKNVLLPWFHFLFSISGIALVAALPFKITPAILKRLFILVLIFTGIVFAVTTADVLFNPRIRCHADPYKMIQLAEKFYFLHSGGKNIPVAVGERWHCGVIEIYSAHHPPAIDHRDVLKLERLRKLIDREGALLFDKHSSRIKKNVLKTDVEGIIFEDMDFYFSTSAGKKKKGSLAFGYLPPGNAKALKFMP